jgi:hypothetical protein
MFRKITALFVAFLLIFSLTGCVFIPSWEQVDVRYDTSEIVSVELYYLTDNGSGERFGRFANIDEMEEELDPIDTLDAEQFSDFVSDLEGLTFTNHFFGILVAANDPVYNYRGYTVKITYQNGDYDILSPTCQLYEMGEDYDENNWNCDEDKWNRFIKDYFTVDQPEKPAPVPVE